MHDELLASLIRGLQQWRDTHEARLQQCHTDLDKRIAEYESAIARAELARSRGVLHVPPRRRISKTPGGS